MCPCNTMRNGSQEEADSMVTPRPAITPPFLSREVTDRAFQAMAQLKRTKKD